MRQSPSRQASFSRLAAGQVCNRRSDILLAATDTFCSQSKPDKGQIDQYRELFYSLISDSDESAKKLIASALSRHYYTPRPVLLYLAMEDAAIAAPILAYSKGLGQFDLLQIIDKTSNLHHRIIANRSDLGKTVITKLQELNDYLVLTRLKDNSAIDISDTLPAKSSLEELVEMRNFTRASRKQEARATLEEMDEILHGGVNDAGKPGHTRSTKNISVEPDDQVESPSKSTAPATNNKIKLAMDELISLANRGRRLGSIEDLLDERPDANILPFANRMLHATTRKNRQDQVAAIRREFGLSAAAANAVFEDHSGDTLAVCLKAADVDMNMAVQIISQSIPNVGLSAHNTERLKKIYPALNLRACKDTVKTWSSSKLSAAQDYEPYAADTEPQYARESSTRRRDETPMPKTDTRKIFGT